MADYQLTQNPAVVLRRADGAHVTIEADNQAGGLYRAWVTAGNTPDAADAPPVRKSFIQQVAVEDFRTANATQATLVSWPLAQQTLYTARFTLMAIDVGNADCRVWHATASAKRVNNGAALVGTPSIVSSHADAGASAWALAADANGNNFRVRVTGAAGRTISWSLLGEVVRARPDGLVD